MTDCAYGSKDCSAPNLTFGNFLESPAPEVAPTMIPSLAEPPGPSSAVVAAHSPGLQDLGLDWEWPECPDAAAAHQFTEAVKVEIHLGDK